MRRSVLVILVGSVIGSGGCDSGSSTGEWNAITSATPGVSSALLTDAHPGWQRADCLSCHALNHDSGYDPATCTGCHGRNGAPVRDPASHGPGAACGSCHARQHAGQGFAAPDDCVTCHVWKPGTTCGTTEDFDVVVVGAGGGGLAAAAALARAGKRVALLEKNDRVGGAMTNFRRGDYRFEASLHAFDGLVEGKGLNVDIFKALGIWGKVQVLRPDPMYRIVYPDFTWDIPADVDEYQAFLQQQFPDSADGIARLFAECKDVNRILVAFLTSQSTGGAPAGVTTEDLLKLQKYMDSTLSEVLAEYFTDQRLIAVWTQLAGFAGTSPDKVSAIFFLAMWNSYHLGGYHYFTGGSQAVSDALAAVVGENGGLVRTQSLVTRIVVEDGRATQVRTADGTCFNARYVVSNANAPDTVNRLMGREHFPSEWLAKMDAMTVGLSAYVVNLGVNHDYRDLFGATHEIMVNESYDTNQPFEALAACDPERTAFAIANYTVLDPSTAPAGKNVIEITTQFAYECNDAWKFDRSHEEYRKYKDELAQVMIRRAERILPGLSQHIEVMEVATPRTIEGFTANPKGSIFGWDNTPQQSTQNRLQQQTPIPNLFLAGAWTFPGGGQSAVLISGAMAAQSILAAMAAEAGSQ